MLEGKGPRGKRQSEHMMSDLHQTVAGLTGEVAAKDATIRALEVSMGHVAVIPVLPPHCGALGQGSQHWGSACNGPTDVVRSVPRFS